MAVETGTLRRVLKQARFGVRAAHLVGRSITARSRALPDVFILGATKAGSTTLTHMLWQHPAHVAPFTKELMYLQHLPDFRANWDYSRIASFLWGRYAGGHARYSVAGYRKFFPLQLAMWRRQSRVGAAITSDCDPFNLYCDVATQRIRALAPDARFIISLRDPVQRAFSDYNMHRVQLGDQRSFTQAIEQELSGAEKRFRKRFLHQSVYAPHIERWFGVFPRERFLIFRAEDLFADSAASARKMFAFLGLDPDVAVDGAAQNRGAYAGRMDSAAEKRLREYFRPFNARLDELLGFEMNWENG